MKRTWHILLILLLLVLVACGDDDEDKNGDSDTSSSNLGQSLSYYDGALTLQMPDDWVVDEEFIDDGNLQIASSTDFFESGFNVLESVPDSGMGGAVTVFLDEGSAPVRYLDTELGSLGQPEPPRIEEMEFKGNPAAHFEGDAFGNTPSGGFYLYATAFQSGGHLVVIAFYSFEGDQSALFDDIANTLTIDIDAVAPAIEPRRVPAAIPTTPSPAPE